MKKIAPELLRFPINVRIFNRDFTQITCDSRKREGTLLARAIDFAHADRVFAGLHLTREDTRWDYGEKRFVTFGTIEGLFVILVWTDRFPSLHVISMRRANRREQKAYQVIHQ
ncbi:BrnT family toxin [beta proteobacterium MWH-UniP1]